MNLDFLDLDEFLKKFWKWPIVEKMLAITRNRWRIQDFPVGAPTSKDPTQRGLALTYYLKKIRRNCIKIKKIRSEGPRLKFY